MYSILEKLVVFILEGAKATPEEGVENTPPRNGRKVSTIVSLIIVLAIAGWYSWYDHKVKVSQEISKVKEENLNKNISELTLANLTLKEERIRLRAEVRNVTQDATKLTRELDKVKLELKTAKENFSDELEITARQLMAITKLNRKIEKLNFQIATYDKDNRIIWDKMITLGQEEGSQ